MARGFGSKARPDPNNSQCSGTATTTWQRECCSLSDARARHVQLVCRARRPGPTAGAGAGRRRRPPWRGAPWARRSPRPCARAAPASWTGRRWGSARAQAQALSAARGLPWPTRFAPLWRAPRRRRPAAPQRAPQAAPAPAARRWLGPGPAQHPGRCCSQRACGPRGCRRRRLRLRPELAAGRCCSQRASARSACRSCRPPRARRPPACASVAPPAPLHAPLPARCCRQRRQVVVSGHCPAAQSAAPLRHRRQSRKARTCALPVLGWRRSLPALRASARRLAAAQAAGWCGSSMRGLLRPEMPAAFQHQ